MTNEQPFGVILAGGLARRMGGGDKPLKMLGDETLLARIIRRVAPQCAALALNANGDPGRFADFDLPVIADSIAEYPGPLAGILAGLDYVAIHHPSIDTVLSMPADCPFLPPDLAVRLEAARQSTGVPLAAAASGGWTHPVIGLWPVTLREALRASLTAGERKIDRFTARFGIAHAEWPVEPFDPFFNANAPEDLAVAEMLAGRYPGA